MATLLEFEDLVSEYGRWLRNRTALREADKGWIEVTTPFLDRHNDCIQIYIKEENSHYRLSDDGHTMRDLEISGVEIKTEKRKELLDIALNGFGVELKNGRIETVATRDTFPLKKHAIVQAILATNDLFYTSQPHVRSLFKEDVEAWLTNSDIRYLRDVTLTGRSGYTFMFDFAIPPSKSMGERLIKVVSNPTASAVKNVAFSWSDTRQARPASAHAFAMLNDRISFDEKSIDALKNYDILPIRWSERDEFRPRLAA